MSALFSPIKLRGLELPNRIMVAPMCQYSSEDGEANDWHFTHINSLALSGAAMFCIEATHVEAIGRITPGCLGLWNDATEAALKPILASVRKRSKTAVAVQLAHAGRKGSSHRPWDGGQQIPLADGGWQTEGPSAVPHKDGELAPLALDAAGLKRVRDAFVAAAKRSERLGIDAIEVHSAHGYLLHQFLSPISNKRTDQYGGSLQNRMRYPLEVFDAVRAAFPDHKPVGIKVSATDWVEGGWDLAQTIEYARELKQRGVDWIDASSGGVSPLQKFRSAPATKCRSRKASSKRPASPPWRSASSPRPSRRKTSSPRGRPTWSRWRVACCTTRAGAGTPPPNSAARSKPRRNTGARNLRRKRRCSARRASGRGERASSVIASGAKQSMAAQQ
jgi:NADPH2 dehydrogenase